MGHLRRFRNFHILTLQLSERFLMSSNLSSDYLIELKNGGGIGDARGGFCELGVGAK